MKQDINYTRLTDVEKIINQSKEKEKNLSVIFLILLHRNNFPHNRIITQNFLHNRKSTITYINNFYIKEYYNNQQRGERMNLNSSYFTVGMMAKFMGRNSYCQVLILKCYI